MLQDQVNGKRPGYRGDGAIKNLEANQQELEVDKI